jgi:hypothetical protein
VGVSMGDRGTYWCCVRFSEKVRMFQKDGKWYADWRDKDGRRLRKSFASKRAAMQHEEDMRAIAHPKKKTLGNRSPQSLAPKSSGGRSSGPRPLSLLERNSSQRAADSNRLDLARLKSSKSSTESKTRVMPIRLKSR